MGGCVVSTIRSCPHAPAEKNDRISTGFSPHFLYTIRQQSVVQSGLLIRIPEPVMSWSITPHELTKSIMSKDQLRTAVLATNFANERHHEKSTWQIPWEKKTARRHSSRTAATLNVTRQVGPRLKSIRSVWKVGMFDRNMMVIKIGFDRHMIMNYN